MPDSLCSQGGGAVALLMPFVSGTIFFTNCSFLGNEADGNIGGGALLVQVGNIAAHLVFRDCAFHSNRATDFLRGGEGGAIHILNTNIAREGSIRFFNCNFTRNDAAVKGGAIFLVTFYASGMSSSCLLFQEFDVFVSNLTVDACSFFQNSAVLAGGAIEAEGHTAFTVSGSVFEQNSARLGAAVGLMRMARTTMARCVFWRQFSSIGGAFYSESLCSTGASIDEKACIQLNEVRFFENFAQSVIYNVSYA